MAFEIRFFGSFQILLDGEPAAFPTHPTANLCARLAFTANRSQTREEVAAMVWPGVDLDKAQNRLRTALVHLRQALEPWTPIQADRQTVMMTLEEVESDLSQAERLHRQSRLSQGQDEERQQLEELLALIGRDFLEGWTEEWATGPRQQWQNVRTQAALRLGHIYFEIDFFELAARESERVFAVDLYQEEAWALHLRAMVELGRTHEATERFRAARRRLRDEMEFDFSPELLDLVRRVGAGQIAKKAAKVSLTTSEREVISRAFEGQLAQDPGSLVPILAGEAFRSEAMQNPLESWALMQRVIDATEGTAPDRIQLILLGINLAGMVDDLENALDYGEWVIENTEEGDPFHGRALSYLGFVCFELRDWESANRYIRRHVELVERMGKPIESAFARCQLASLMWHEGDLIESEKIYGSCYEIVEQDDTVRGRYNTAIIQANLGFVMTIRQEWDRAEQNFERAQAVALANKFDYVRGTVMGPLSAARMMMGRPEGAPQMASLSLAQTYRSRYRRMNQISADYAAITLIKMGHQTEGLAMLDRFAEFRAKDRHERSVAEEILTEWTRGLAPAVAPSPEWQALTRPAEVIARACDLLDQI